MLLEEVPVIVEDVVENSNARLEMSIFIDEPKVGKVK